ncbi:MAG: hypothetical protein U5L96_14135 [Owenweeksia sp.]|nr:hypothetical protein [Owenweeksia sp.]
MLIHLLGKSVEGHPGWVQFLPPLSFLIPLFSALRLAKFNIDTRQTSYFIGLPTPANALLHYSIALWTLHSESDAIRNFLTHPAFLVALVVLSSALGGQSSVDVIKGEEP